MRQDENQPPKVLPVILQPRQPATGTLAKLTRGLRKRGVMRAEMETVGQWCAVESRPVPS